MGEVEKQRWLDDFCLDRLSDLEKQQFAAELQQDASLAEALQEMQQLYQTMHLHQQRQDLRESMQTWHQTMLEQEPEPTLSQTMITLNTQIKHLWVKYGQTISIAAAVAILVTFSTIIILNNFKNLEKQQTHHFEAYKELKRDLDEVKRSQQSMLQKQAQIDKNSTPPAAMFGATAFVISANGYLVTNYHVIKDANAIFVEHKREDTLVRYRVSVVYQDITNDLAILRIEDETFIGFPPLPYAFKSEESLLGEPVYTLAYPRNDMVYGEGVVSAQTGYKGDTTAYQISIPVNPGNSGGPLLDAKGNLIGIVEGKDTKLEGTAFAIKTKYLQTAVDSVMRNPEIFEQRPIFLPQQNAISWLPRPQQVQRLEPFVFVVKVYGE